MVFTHGTDRGTIPPFRDCGAPHLAVSPPCEQDVVMDDLNRQGVLP
jgi:hypothetical protein